MSTKWDISTGSVYIDHLTDVECILDGIIYIIHILYMELYIIYIIHIYVYIIHKKITYI
jgi:hypothetical protein